MARQKRAKQGSKRVIARGSKMVTSKREVARLWQHEREPAISMRQQQVFGIMQR